MMPRGIHYSLVSSHALRTHTILCARVCVYSIMVEHWVQNVNTLGLKPLLCCWAREIPSRKKPLARSLDVVVNTCISKILPPHLLPTRRNICQRVLLELIAHLTYTCRKIVRLKSNKERETYQVRSISQGRLKGKQQVGKCYIGTHTHTPTTASNLPSVYCIF